MIDELNEWKQKVESVDWILIHDDYGPAIDVENDLLKLVNDHEYERDAGFYNLSQTLIHQSHRYEASLVALPYLFDLLKLKSVEDKHQVLLLTSFIVLGCQNWYLPHGIRIDDFEQERQSLLQIFDKELYVDIYSEAETAIDDLVQTSVFEVMNEREKDLFIFLTSWFPRVFQNRDYLDLVIKRFVCANDKSASIAMVCIFLISSSVHVKLNLQQLHSWARSASGFIRLGASLLIFRLSGDSAKESIGEVVDKALDDLPDEYRGTSWDDYYPYDLAEFIKLSQSN
jgi:hypothetical protein